MSSHFDLRDDEDADAIVESAETSLRLDKELRHLLSEEERLELSQDAYERLVRGSWRDEYEGQGALLAAQRIAHRLAFNYVEKRDWVARRMVVGNATPNASASVDEAPEPDDNGEISIDLAAGIEAVEHLSELQQAIVRAVVVDNLTDRDICDVLRITRDELNCQRAIARKRVDSVLLECVGGPVTRRKRLALLSAYLYGDASEEEGKRAEGLLSTHPDVRRELRAIRAAHEAATLGLPELGAYLYP